MRFSFIIILLLLLLIASTANAFFSSVFTSTSIDLPQQLASPVLKYPALMQEGRLPCFTALPAGSNKLSLEYNPLCQYCGSFGLEMFDPLDPNNPIVPEVTISCKADLVIVSTSSSHSASFYSALRGFIAREATNGRTTRYVELGTTKTPYKTLYTPGAFFDGKNHEKAFREINSIVDPKAVLILSDSIPSKQVHFPEGNKVIQNDDHYGNKFIRSGRKTAQQSIPVSRISGSDVDIEQVLLGLKAESTTPSKVQVMYSENLVFPQLPKTAFPLPGNDVRITSAFGPRTNPLTGRFQSHSGTDLSAAVGTEVYAPMDGTVRTLSVDNNCGKGLYLKSDDYQFGFCHLSQIVKTGEVKKGELIAKTGKTGASKGPHLHYTFRYNEQRMYPMLLFLNLDVTRFIGFDNTLSTEPIVNAEAQSAQNKLLYGNNIVECAENNEIAPALLWQLTVNKLANGNRFNCGSDPSIQLLRKSKPVFVEPEELSRITGEPFAFYGKYVGQPAYLLAPPNGSSSELVVFKSTELNSDALSTEQLKTGATSVIAHGSVLQTPAVIPIPVTSTTPLTSGDLLLASQTTLLRDNSLPSKLRNLQAKAISLRGNPLYTVKIG